METYKQKIRMNIKYIKYSVVGLLMQFDEAYSGFSRIPNFEGFLSPNQQTLGCPLNANSELFHPRRVQHLV